MKNLLRHENEGNLKFLYNNVESTKVVDEAYFETPKVKRRILGSIESSLDTMGNEIDRENLGEKIMLKALLGKEAKDIPDSLVITGLKTMDRGDRAIWNSRATVGIVQTALAKKGYNIGSAIDFSFARGRHQNKMRSITRSRAFKKITNPEAKKDYIRKKVNLGTGITNTQAAVAEFQIDNGLTVDGVPGKQFAQKMIETLTPINDPAGSIETDLLSNANGAVTTDLLD